VNKMKCPKCGFFGPDYLDACKKCGKDLRAEKEKLGLFSYRVQGSRFREGLKIESSPAQDILPEPEAKEETVTKPETTIPQMASLSGKSKKEKEKSLDFPPPEGSSAGIMEEDFQFNLEKEDSFISPSIRESLDNVDLAEDLSSSKGAQDDFEFPDFKKSEVPPDVELTEKDNLSSLSIPESELESIELSPEKDTDDLSEEETLIDSEAMLSKEDIDLELSEESLQGKKQKEESGTQMLSPEEIESILKSETSEAGKSKKGITSDKSKTELLDEDELSKILANLDTDSSKSE